MTANRRTRTGTKPPCLTQEKYKGGNHVTHALRADSERDTYNVPGGKLLNLPVSCHFNPTNLEQRGGKRGLQLKLNSHLVEGMCFGWGAATTAAFITRMTVSMVTSSTRTELHLA